MYSPEFELLLLSLRADVSGTAERAELLIRQFSPDFDGLLQRAALHCVRPQLAALFGQLSPDLVPDRMRIELDAACRRNLLNQMNYIAEFFRVRELLGREGIRMIPFKGFWLGHEAYVNIADRESLDVDVFTDESDLERIKELMTSAGYSEEAAYHGLTFPRIREQFQEYTFEKIEGGVSTFRIEFHWGICPPDYLMRVRLEDLSDQVTAGTFQGRELEVFTPSAQMLLSLLHHGGKDRFALLKQVNDIAMLMKNGGEIDWQWLVKVLRRFHAEPLLYVALNLAASAAGGDIPGELEEQVDSGRIRRMADDRMKVMDRSPGRWSSAAVNSGNWLFRMRSRTGLMTRLRLTAATARGVLAGKRRKE
jgi:hypothetical protein